MKAANEAILADTPAAMTFDTLSAAQELRNAGFEDRQAEAAVTTISRAMSETVATKADLKILDLRFESLERSLRQEMAALENKIVIKLGALMVTMTFLLLAIGPFYFRWVMSLMG